MLETYLRWYAHRRKNHALLDSALTDNTIINRLNSLKAAMKLHTGHKYCPADNKRLMNHINNRMVPKGLVSTQGRRKPLACLEVVEDLIRFKYCSDEYTGNHSRMWNQAGFATCMMLYVGLRPGELIESHAWMQSNEGFHYKDIDLVHRVSEDYTG